MSILQGFYNALNDQDKQNLNRPNQCKNCLFGFDY